MSGVLASVDKRTQLVGENRLELLLFYLHSRHLFALNVFKVKEVVKIPHISKVPHAHPKVAGVVDIRGESIPVIDLRKAICMPDAQHIEDTNLVITEYNRTVQGFLIGKVDQIINMTWSDIMPPPTAIGKNHYLTALTKIKRDGQEHLVEIIDVEKVLAEIIEYEVNISDDILDQSIVNEFAGRKILHADDSPTARKQVSDTLSQLGIEIIPARNGLEALNMLKRWADEGKDVEKELLMVITDAEMPAMDGYRLTHEIRNDNRLKNLHIVLNTSLSGSFNQAMVEKVGCNAFLSKFQPILLVEEVQARLKAVLEQQP
ncbi:MULTISPECIES: chemotaxis protein CheV [Pseudoalteromonas]|jgi:two-component system chemotaxis response regulator CheV|uniref:Chemotaxis protein CheV n=1 Tax=Pseudoalteromonas lipolytica TaxID=570156 RepID=A0AAD0RWU7_9GAMM|nr:MULTISPECIES: chemotaxis protein CheV [Pseudoalteromonas]AXV63961.1 chemotaxis protein CheV [Pseudoalteromonas donghaensis]EWH04259.1 chemotaxis protein CheW [Pseudoalteromonas lipolytica SCSIO 04301]MCC9660687.1 chemotaxis protein CheV [Pseudoalteromonas sp. MB41]QLJ08447.1 chemotaxis protein CheV [Pseudoalteromonas sp. JSTW]|tara:strand:+ start:6793 stop:7743 length:951 start_codon:yes stop_codon:yes gene_type:complete